MGSRFFRYPQIVVLAISIMLLAAFPAHAQGDKSSTTFEPVVCPFTNNGAYPIDCGWLSVPEDHANPQGKHIHLAVAIIHSLNHSKAADPVVYLAGGPGGAFVSTAPALPYQFGLASLLSERDVIIVDQRGMGLSQPRLSCIALDEPQDYYGETFPPGDFFDQIRRCRENLKQQDIDPTYYNTPQNAADFADLRLALGYPQINLYGTSWGTRLALVILRDHPEGIRSVILDSTLPPQINPSGETGRLFERSFGEFEASCAADLLCRTAYPHIRQTFLDTYDRLKANPAKLMVQGQMMAFTAESFSGAVYMLLRDKAGVEKLPAFITAIAHEDYSTIIEQTEAILRTPPDKMPDQGAYLTMNCPDSLATTTEADIQARLASYPEAFQVGEPFQGLLGYQMCQAWGMPPATSNAPTLSAVPTLLLSGQFDPLTPPEWGNLAAQTLTRGTFVTFPTLGHGDAVDACAQRVMVAFLHDPAVKPDTTCTTAMAGMQFILGIDVTRPFVRMGAALLAALALVGIGSAGLAFVRDYRRVAWRATLRKMGAIPLALSLVGIILLTLDRNHRVLGAQLGSVSVIQIVIPLVMAIQAAAAFAPDDEPGLEMLLALPRPVAWLIMERLAVAFIAQSGIALIGAAVVLALNPGQDVPILLLGWIPSALFLSGIGIYETLRSRQVLFGVMVAGFLWMVFGLFGDLLLPGGSFPFPFNIIQPFLWAIQVHASPVDLLPADYWLNRLFLTGAGIGLLMLALREVRDTEKLLLNASQKARRKQTAIAPAQVPAVSTLQPAVQVGEVPVQIRALRQWRGIARVEFRMHWQRRTFKVLTLATILAMSAILLILGSDLSRLIPTLPSPDMLPPEQAQIIRGAMLAMVGSSILLVVMMLVLPLVIADSVPLDAQLRMDEVLNSLPLSRGVYLAGKIAGAWLAALSSLAISAAAVSVIWRLRVGDYNPLPFLDVLLAGALPLLVIHGGLGILIGATQPSRRRALFAIIIVLIVPALIPLSGTLWQIVLPGHMDIMNHFLNTSLTAMVTTPSVLPAPPLTDATLRQTLLIGAAQLLVVWAAVWVWQRRTDCVWAI